MAHEEGEDEGEDGTEVDEGPAFSTEAVGQPAPDEGHDDEDAGGDVGEVVDLWDGEFYAWDGSGGLVEGLEPEAHGGLGTTVTISF